MSKNQRIAVIEGKFFSVIDLTDPLREDTEVYPGDPKPEKKVFSQIEKTGWQHHTYELSDHVFHPHCDAPKHQNPELQDKGMEIFGPESLFNDACLIDLSKASDAEDFGGIKYLVRVKKEHLIEFASSLLKREAILIRTGYDRWLEENWQHNPQNLPYLDKEAAEYIASFKNIGVVGIDSLTVDPVGSHIAHQILKDKMIVESLVHLHVIPYQRSEKFTLLTAPIRIVGATGGPVAAYAIIKE